MAHFREWLLAEVSDVQACIAQLVLALLQICEIKCALPHMWRCVCCRDAWQLSLAGQSNAARIIVTNPEITGGKVCVVEVVLGAKQGLVEATLAGQLYGTGPYNTSPLSIGIVMASAELHTQASWPDLGGPVSRRPWHR
jgi:hypothetical protein